MSQSVRAVVFTKLPVAGRVKTRLAREVGDLTAARLYEAWVPPWIAMLAGMAPTLSLEVCLAKEAGEDSAALTRRVHGWFGREVEVTFQCDGGLGQRLRHALDRQFDHGWREVVVLGSDAPHLKTDLILENLRMLADADIVLGPSLDGGYYLIGLSSRPEDVLDPVRWSSGETLQDTLRSAERKGWRIGIGPESYDIDTLADLHRLLEEDKTTWSCLRRILAEALSSSDQADRGRE